MLKKWQKKIFVMWNWQFLLKRLIKTEENSCKKLQQNEYLQTHMTSSCTFSYSKWFCLVHSSKICYFGKYIYGLVQFDLVGCRSNYKFSKPTLQKQGEAKQELGDYKVPWRIWIKSMFIYQMIYSLCQCKESQIKSTRLSRVFRGFEWSGCSTTITWCSHFENVRRSEMTIGRL
jgi:hypothetical protein